MLIIANNYLHIVALRSSGPGSAPAALAALCKWNKQGGSCPKTLGMRGAGGQGWYLGNALTMAVGATCPPCAVLPPHSPPDGQLDPICPSFTFSEHVGCLGLLSKPRFMAARLLAASSPRPVRDVFLLTWQSFPCQCALTARGFLISNPGVSHSDSQLLH